MNQENREEKQINQKPEDESRLLQRATQGDESVMADVRQVLDAHPVIWQMYSDLTTETEKLLLASITGTDLLLAESLRRQLEAKKQELGHVAHRRWSGSKSSGSLSRGCR